MGGIYSRGDQHAQRHEGELVRWLPGPPSSLEDGSVGGGVRDVAGLLGRARPRRAAMLQKAAWQHRRVLSRG